MATRKTKQINVRLTMDAFLCLQALAEKEERTLAQVVRRALVAYLKARPA